MNLIKSSRKECFFGIHFDFHAIPGEVVGEIYEPHVVAEMLDRVKPDFVQCDTKGHAGLSSYPTKAGTQADVIAHDVLRMWRDLTKERGIRLYGHHSGLFDQAVLKKHPQWGVVDRNGNLSTDFVSVFSPYVDEVLIPQLMELCVEYELDGVWIDGDCWGAKADYGMYGAAEYMRVTGKRVPRGDEDREEFEEFCRQGFLDYVKHYINILKAGNPGFEVASNWIYAASMPTEPRIVPDFLSGDYDPSNSVESARFEGRCLETRGITWDLMAWGQHAIPVAWKTENRTTKEYAQYCQEAAQIISMGGGFQFFNLMYGSGGTIQEWMIPTWERVAAFCRERELCHQARLYQELGVICTDRQGQASTDSLYSRADIAGCGPLRAWINALSDMGLSPNVLYEYQLQRKLAQYKAIVLPSSKDLKEESKKALLSYAMQGGSLILDSVAALHFSDVLQAKMVYREAAEVRYLDGGGALCAVETPLLCADTESGDIAGYLYASNTYHKKLEISSFSQAFGKGRIHVICPNVGKTYGKNRCSAYSGFIRQQLQWAGYEPKVTVEGSALVDVIVTQKEDMLLVNLVNMAGNHNVPGVRAFGEIPALGALEVSVLCDSEPAEIWLEPGHHKPDYVFDRGLLRISVPGLKIHTVITIK